MLHSLGHTPTYTGWVTELDEVVFQRVRQVNIAETAEPEDRQVKWERQREGGIRDNGREGCQSLHGPADCHFYTHPVFTLLHVDSVQPTFYIILYLVP